MDFAISGVTDIGIKKTTNQDSLFMCKFQTSFGEAVFSVLCDGMGGLEKGEVASASGKCFIESKGYWSDIQLYYVEDTKE